MKHETYHYTTLTTIELTRDEAHRLYCASRTHYDARCRELVAGRRLSLVYGLATNESPQRDEKASITLSLDELDLLVKVAEQLDGADHEKGYTLYSALVDELRATITENERINRRPTPVFVSPTARSVLAQKEAYAQARSTRVPSAHDVSIRSQPALVGWSFIVARSVPARELRLFVGVQHGPIDVTPAGLEALRTQLIGRSPVISLYIAPDRTYWISPEDTLDSHATSALFGAALCATPGWSTASPTLARVHAWLHALKRDGKAALPSNIREQWAPIAAALEGDVEIYDC